MLNSSWQRPLSCKSDALELKCRFLQSSCHLLSQSFIEFRRSRQDLT